MAYFLNVLGTPPPPGFRPGLPDVGAQATQAAVSTTAGPVSQGLAVSPWVDAWALALVVVLTIAILVVSFAVLYLTAVAVIDGLHALWRLLRPRRAPGGSRPTVSGPWPVSPPVRRTRGRWEP